VIHPPAVTLQKGRNPTVTIATILAGQLDDLTTQSLFIVFGLGLKTLGGPGLANYLAGPPLGNPQSPLQALYATPAPLGA